MIEKEAMYKLTYGLFMLTTTDGEKQNGCIVNTVMMMTDNPKRIVVFVNKSNYSEELLRKTKICNVSILTEKTPFDVFKQFGFQSGKSAEKIKTYPDTAYASNGISYISKNTNAYISGKVISAVDLGTHTLFIADITL